jgi:hypothetical protein
MIDPLPVPLSATPLEHAIKPKDHDCPESRTQSTAIGEEIPQELAKSRDQRLPPIVTTSRLRRGHDARNLGRQHFLYLRPLPQGQGELRPIFFALRVR